MFKILERFSVGDKAFSEGDNVFSVGDKAFSEGDKVFSVGDEAFSEGDNVISKRVVHFLDFNHKIFTNDLPKTFTVINNQSFQNTLLYQLFKI